MKSRILAILLTLTMIVGLGVSTFAAVITIDPNKPDGYTGEDPTYTYYVMMKASVGTGDKVSYFVETEALATALDGLKVGEDDLFTVTKAGDIWNVVINKKSDDSAFTGIEVAAALQTIKDKAIATDDAADDNTITLAYDAYVLIESSLGKLLIVDTYTTNKSEKEGSADGETRLP